MILIIGPFSSPVESPRKGDFAEYASREDKSRPFLKFRFEWNNGQDCPISAEVRTRGPAVAGRVLARLRLPAMPRVRGSGRRSYPNGPEQPLVPLVNSRLVVRHWPRPACRRR